MEKSKASTPGDPVKRWIIFGIPLLLILGSPMHFIYEWSGYSIMVGIFAPVNESVWEHLKLTFWPMLIFWLTGYSVLSKRFGIPINRWIVSCSAAELVCPLVVVTFFYTYTGAFGIESLILDMFSLLLALVFAQVLALHVYKYAKLKPYSLYMAAAILILLAAVFTVFTFAPPHIPLFKDSLTGSYGL